MTAAAVSRFADLEALSRAAAEEVLAVGRAAVAARGRFDLALSGGSTPRRLLQLLAAAGADAMPWRRTHLWWCDERAVPPDAADSNFGMATQALAPLGLDERQLHRMRGEAPDLGRAAEDYQRELCTELCSELGDPPRLDLALLGLGPDAHTASLFPHSAALAATTWVTAALITSPLVGGSAWRLSLTAPTLAAARGVLLLAAGRDKAAAVAAVLRGALDPDRYPAQLLARAPRPVQWFIDEAAASQLPLFAAPGDLP